MLTYICAGLGVQVPENQGSTGAVHEFGPFRLESTERLLLRAGQPVSLTPKAFDLLVYLVDHAGRLVTKQALMSALWPDSFVEETNLSFTVSTLRKALGNGQDGEQFIQTVPTRGYRFVAPVTSVQDQPVSATSQKPARSIKPLIRRVAISALAVSVVAMLPVVVRHMREKTDTPPVVRFTLPMPPELRSTESARPLSQISPDGRRVALVVETRAGIWLRNLDGLTSLPVPGTDGAQAAFWSPDGERLAFSTESQLKTVRLSDGTVQTLCDSCAPTGGGTWSRKGTIVFATREGLFGIPESGGMPQQVTHIDRSRGEIGHLYPSFLPDGVQFLFVNRNKDATASGLFVAQIGSLKSELVLKEDLPAIYNNAGFLLFLRSGTLMAQRFDPGHLRFSGEAHPLVRAASGNPLVSQVAFSASGTGALTYSIVERPISQFQWVSRAGEPQQLVGEPAPYSTFDLSADGRRLAFARLEANYSKLGVIELGGDRTTPLTFGTSSHADPRWMPDGQKLVATRWLPLPQSIVQISPDGLEASVSVPEDGNVAEDVSRDGRHLLYRQSDQRLWEMSFSAGSKPVPVREAPAGRMNQAQFSPDSRWITYHSNESGRLEVYVTPFPPTGEHRPVSSGGGVQPVWRQDGRELYYLGLDGTLNAVAVRPGNPPQFSTRRQLFETGLLPNEGFEQYAASADGQRFLLLKVVDDRNRSSIGVILGWPAILSPAPSR